MWSDRESSDDFLNFTELADQVAVLAASPDVLPVSIGVFGTWGTGKSTVLKLVGAQLATSQKPPLVIEFDAWLYQGFDDAKAALMEVVADVLLEEAKNDEGLLKKVQGFASRVNYFRALGRAAEFGVGMAFGVPPGLLTRAGSAISSMVSGNAAPDGAGAVNEAGKAAGAEWSKLVKPGKERTPPKEIAAFRKEFGEILHELDRTLVLFIDNLDRCLPDVAIGTLEAIRLFLFMPGTAFIVAADEDMIRHSVAKHFDDPNATHVRDYLDKVIQVPFRVPRVGIEDVRAYMYSLFVSFIAPAALPAVQAHLLEALQNGWRGQTFDAGTVDSLAGQPAGLVEMLGTADRLAPILALAPNIGGNPRIVKRLLNAVMLRRRLAVARGMNVDLATLAKLAVFERSTDAAATQALYTLVMEAREGSELLLLPDEALPEKVVRPTAPPQWSGLDSFLNDWRRLEPKFGDLAALQPALFLSRDVMAPSARRDASGPVTAAIEALAAATSVTSPVAKSVAEGLSAAERVVVMAALVSRLREEDWSQRAPGVHGAMILGEASVEARHLLQALVDNVPLKTMNKSVAFALRRYKYLKES